MADTPAGFQEEWGTARIRSRPHRYLAGERFLTRPMTAGLTLYGLFALTFSYFQIRGDALVYFNLLRRYFGEEPDFAFAYQFGSALWNAPFFLGHVPSSGVRG